MAPIRFLLFMLLSTGVGCAANRDPESVRLVTEDIDRFWAAFDEAGPEVNPERLQAMYLDAGSAGLVGFVDGRIRDAETLSGVVRRYGAYYRSARSSTMRIREFEEIIRSDLRRFDDLYPDALFPDIYFVIGAMNSGGTTARDALIVGAEMYGLTADTPIDELSSWHRNVLRPVEDVPRIVAHELVHVQQPFSFRNAFGGSLLYHSIREGAADFVSELVSGSHINDHVHEWANPREAELWDEFSRRMHDADLSGWIGSASEVGRPPDLGYWMGYRIAACYYRRADDKTAAVAEIIDMTNARRFLERSGYPDSCSREEQATASPGG